MRTQADIQRDMRACREEMDRNSERFEREERGTKLHAHLMAVIVGGAFALLLLYGPEILSHYFTIPNPEGYDQPIGPMPEP